MTSASVSVAQARHLVRIQSDGARLSYVNAQGEPAATIHVKPGHVVQWHFEHGNFSIVFKGKSPFAEAGYAGNGGVPTRDAQVTGPAGKYSYAVTVVPLQGNPIVDDPDVIVGDGE